MDNELYPCLIILPLVFCVGLDSEVIYPQGISCTMPEEHQLRLMQAIPGLEKVAIVKPGNYINNLTVINCPIYKTPATNLRPLS